MILRSRQIIKQPKVLWIVLAMLLVTMTSCSTDGGASGDTTSGKLTCIWKSAAGTVTMCETRDDMDEALCASNIGQVHSFGGTPASTELAESCPSQGSVGSCKPYHTEYVLFDTRDYRIICGPTP